eukprot:jgi/Mesen1/7683/ME000403S06863
MGSPSMPVHERMTLSPFMKWKKYGRVPWKFFINITLTFLLTVQVSFLNRSTPYLEHTRAALTGMFLPSGFKLAKKSPRGGELPVYTFDKFSQLLSHVANTYKYAALASYVGQFEPHGNASLTVHLLDERQEVYNLQDTPYGPFHIGNFSQLRAAVENMSAAEVQVRLHNVESDARAGATPICWLWTVLCRFDTTSRSHIRFDFRLYWKQSRDKYCVAAGAQGHEWSRPRSALFWLAVAIVALAIVSLALTARSIVRSVRLYRMARDHYSADNMHARSDQLPLFWESLSLGDKLRFFNLWVVATLVCNVAAILSGLLYITPLSSAGYDQHWWVHLLMGIAGAAAWAQNTQYFEFDKELAVFLLALRTGVPYILRLVVAIGPVFVGYALFAWTFFGAFNTTFNTFGSSAVMLFSIVNGDSIHDTFQLYTEEHLVIGRLFLVSFIMGFIYCVLNVFIYIMEDAVHSTKLLYRRNQQNSIFGSSGSANFFMDDELLQEMLSPFNQLLHIPPSPHSHDGGDAPPSPRGNGASVMPRGTMRSFRSTYWGSADGEAGTNARGGLGAVLEQRAPPYQAPPLVEEDGDGGRGGHPSSMSIGRSESMGLGGSLSRRGSRGRGAAAGAEEGDKERSMDGSSAWHSYGRGPSLDRGDSSASLLDATATAAAATAGPPSSAELNTDHPAAAGESTAPENSSSAATASILEQAHAVRREPSGALESSVGSDMDTVRRGLARLRSGGGGSSSARMLGGSEGESEREREREPLLSQLPRSPRLRHSVSAAGTTGSGAWDARDLQRVAVVDYVLKAQERLHQQHLFAFSERLAALYLEHQRGLAHAHEQIVDMLDRRLHRVLAPAPSTSPPPPAGIAAAPTGAAPAPPPPPAAQAQQAVASARGEELTWSPAWLPVAGLAPERLH